MRFGGLRSRANARERILETSLGQNAGFLKALGQDPWAERAAVMGLWGQLITYLGVGRGKEKGGLQKNFPTLKRILETLPLSG